MRKFSVQQIAFVGFGLAAATVFALAVIAWYVAQQALDAAKRVSHTHEVLSAIGNAESSLFRAEAGQRAYLAVRRQAFLDDRDAAVESLGRQIDNLAQLTQDNGEQQRRTAELRKVVENRVQVYRETQDLAESGLAFSVEQRLDEGMRVVSLITPVLGAMSAEERSLLTLRQDAEAVRTHWAQLIFAAMGFVLLLLLPLMFGRIRNELRARQEAEASSAVERRYDDLHAQALTLYNAETDRRETLDGTLQLLSGEQLFPVSAFYAHEDWGSLRLAASHGTPADIKPMLRLDDGLVGLVARTGRAVYLDAIDDAGGLRIETGLASVRPAALLFSPVSHQGKLLGVLALGASVPLAERDRRFVERLCAQFGVALHNLSQVEGLNELAEQLRERGEDIQRQNEQLERASRMKSEFVANMSHELRTPLNAVIGFSEIMRDGLVGDLSAEQREYIGDIYSSGKHLLALINDILDLSKVEAGQMALDLGAAAPAELAATGVAVVREKANLRNIRLTDIVAPGLDRLRLDLRRAKQVVFNLLSNAVKFTPDGGAVTLHLQRVPRDRIEALREADDTRVFAPREVHDAYLEISVSDTGIGISPGGLRELFQPFVQIDSSLSRKYDGTGLGLTMTQRLAELHGGGLMVRSAPGQGSVFTVWLPWREVGPPDEAAADLPAVGVPLPIAPRADAGAPLVLLVEDDPRAASLMRLQLQSEGYRVELARNAESGLQRATELQPQAIVLDIILPGMDGWDLLARLKDFEATRRIPVVIVSITDEPQRGFALGAAQVLTKPVSQDDLLGALRAMGLDASPADAHVLVVDDDPKAVTLVSKLLEAAGFKPDCAYGGQQALDMVRRQRPDVIVLDLMMPHISGFDVVEALAREPDTADVPVLVLTAKLITARDRELLRGRVQRVLEKAEFQPASLLAEVKRALAKRQRASAAPPPPKPP
jgi:signal transduction histidine kinase/DNA-binding response OmpR family regulator/CHASE3 domain sensor protein